MTTAAIRKLGRRPRVYRPRMTSAGRRRDGEKRREAILNAALAVFVERGLLGAGIEDVRKAAGASPSSMYHFFGGLTEVTLALLVRTFSRLFAHLTARVVTASTPREAVLALVAGQIEWVRASPDEARFMYQATSLELAAEVTEAVQAAKAQQMAPLVERFAGWMAQGALPPLSPLQFDVVVLGVAHESCRRWLAGAALDPVWMEETLPRLAWESLRALRGGEPSPERRQR